MEVARGSHQMAVPGIRIKDGLFVGGAESAEDYEGLVESKVTRVVNCCGAEIPDHWAASGIRYLSFNWADGSGDVVLDTDDEVIHQVSAFVDEALQREEGVLIHSANGNSLCCCVVVAYIMLTHRWNLQKTTEFVKIRGLEMQLNTDLAQQLEKFEQRLASAQSLGTDWDSLPLGEDSPDDELLLRNTHINVSAMAPIDLTPTPPRTSKLRWADEPDINRPLEEPPSPCKAGFVSPPALRSAQQATAPHHRESDSAAVAAKAEAASGTGTDTEAEAGPEMQATMAAATTAATAMTQPANGNVSGSCIKIKTRCGGVVQCSPEQIVHKRYGLKFKCSTIVLEYAVPAHQLKAHHAVIVDLQGTDSDGCGDADLATRLKQAHAPWLSAVSDIQLTKLVGRLRRGAATAPAAAENCCC